MMSRYLTQQRIKVMQAYVNKEAIESTPIGVASMWDDASEPCWNWSKYDYRVKPRDVYHDMYINTHLSGIKVAYRSQAEAVLAWDNAVSNIVSIGVLHSVKAATWEEAVKYMNAKVGK